MDSNAIIKIYVPSIVSSVAKKGLPKDEKELIEFSKELSKMVINKMNIGNN